MKKSIKSMFLLFVLLTILVMSGCAPAPTPEPTFTPLPPTITPSPVPPTFTPEPTATATATSTPVPVCNTGNIIQGVSDDKIELGYIDIVSVSTSLDGTKLTAVFTLRDIPNEITINRKEMSKGQPEIAWAVAVDTDNNPDTGEKAFLTGKGQGFESFLLAFEFKMEENEQTGSIEDLLRNWVSIAVPQGNGRTNMNENGTLSVNTEEKTLTITGNIKNISPTSYLYFYTYYAVPQSPPIVDELCQR